MPPAARDFHQREAASVDQTGRAAQHGVGALHGFHGDASPLGDGHALPDIVLGKRVGDASAIGDIALLVRRRLASRQNTFRGEKILKK